MGFPHLNQAGPAVGAINQAENRPHDRTPLLITGMILAQSGFGGVARHAGNDVVGRGENFVAAACVKSIHGFGRASGLGGKGFSPAAQTDCQRALLPADVKGSG